MAVVNGRWKNQTRRVWFEGSSVYPIFSAEERGRAIKSSSSAEFGRIQFGFCPRLNLPVILLSIVDNRLGVSIGRVVFANIVYADKVLPLAPLS